MEYANGERLRWAGVDVGGRRKGFHLALVDAARFLRCQHALTAEEAVAILEGWRPALIAVDSPRAPAVTGKSRPEERCLAKALCRIRYTPTRGYRAQPILRVDSRWMASLRRAGGAQPRPSRMLSHGVLDHVGRSRSGTRARWSQRVLERQALEDLPELLNQDFRDAIGAALTARAHT